VTNEPLGTRGSPAAFEAPETFVSMRTTVTSSVSKVPTAGQHGYIDVGGHFRGARTDDELAQAILHRENDAVRTLGPCRALSSWDCSAV
jgi:hypothetical protein